MERRSDRSASVGQLVLLVLCASLLFVALPLARDVAGGDEPPTEKAPVEKPLFTLAHLSDTHCTVTKANRSKRFSGDPRYLLGVKLEHWKDLVHSFQVLAGTVDFLNEEVQPDLVVVTGDLTDRGRPLSDMRQVKSILDGLDCPYYPVMGDHDLGKSVAAFEKDRDENSYVQVFGKRCYSFDHEGWHFSIVGIYPDDAELEWLEKDLDANATRPTVFCTHRLVICPEFVRRAAKRSHGVELLMPRAEDVKALIAAHPSVVLVLSGHIHVNLELVDPGLQALCLSTDALGEVPHEFRILRFYADRAETEFCRGGTAEGIEKGQWTRRRGRLPSLLKKSLAALREATRELEGKAED